MSETTIMEAKADLEQLIRRVTEENSMVTIKGFDGKEAVLLSAELLEQISGKKGPAGVPAVIREILKRYKKKLEQMFDDKLIRVIVYGDYVKGCQSKQADVDVMVLMDVSSEELSRHSAIVSDYTFDFNRVYRINIIPTVQTVDSFEREKSQYALYQSIAQEGICID